MHQRKPSLAFRRTLQRCANQPAHEGKARFSRVIDIAGLEQGQCGRCLASPPVGRRSG